MFLRLENEPVDEDEDEMDDDDDEMYDGVEYDGEGYDDGLIDYDHMVSWHKWYL